MIKAQRNPAKRNPELDNEYSDEYKSLFVIDKDGFKIPYNKYLLLKRARGLREKMEKALKEAIIEYRNRRVWSE